MNDGRATQAELLDDPNFDPQLAARSYKLMATVNRWLGGSSMVEWFLRREAPALREVCGVGTTERPLRIVDIGAGICDIPLRVGRNMARQGIVCHWTCLEPSPVARRIATETLASQPSPAPIDLLPDNVYEHHPAEPYDLAVGSMFFHHLDDESIVQLVEHLRPMVRRSLLINDLERNRLHHFGARLLSLPLPREIRHDALLSIRRSFRPGELHQLLGPHGLKVRQHRRMLYRLGTMVEFNRVEACCRASAKSNSAEGSNW